MSSHVHPLFADLFELFWPNVNADYDAALANAREAEQRAASKPSPLDDCTLPEPPDANRDLLVKSSGGLFSEEQRD